MKRELLEEYYNKRVAVATENARGRYFWFYGTLAELTDEYLILKYKTGMKRLLLGDIANIHLDTKRGDK